MTQTELEKQILEILNRNYMFLKEYDKSAAKEIASLKMEGMYEREFVLWIGEVDVKYHSARFNVWILHDDFKNRMTTDELYEYWQTNVRDK